MTDELTNSILKKFWENTMHQTASAKDEWNEQVKIIHQCGKGLEETIRYLHYERPSLDIFMNWILAGKKFVNPDTLTENTLSANDLIFFKENGYVVIHNAVSDIQCSEARQAIIEYLDIDLADISSWYKDHEEMRGLMLMFYHHPALEANRNSPRIRKAYEQLYETSNIHAVVDKVSFNPPEIANYKFKGSPLHWDVSLQMPVAFKLQGLLYLSDVEINGGAFNCVPGFHTKIEEWLANLPPNINPRNEAILQLKPIAIPGKAGDFIIWHQALPHCASPNNSDTPRFVQYHTYDPDDIAEPGIWK